MDDDFPALDGLAKKLMALGAFGEEDLEEFKRLELLSISSARKEDALMLFARLPQSDPAKRALQAGLDDLRHWMKARVAAAKSKESPWLCFVSGAPGAGKTVLLERLLKKHPSALLASADDFKERFKTMLPSFIGDTPEPARSNLEKSVYIHRITALPSWEMVDEAIDAKKDLAVEMLGMGAAQDERTLRRALAKGYRVEVIHVGCSVEVGIARAARRHFEQKAKGEGGRWVGLSQAAGKQRAILDSFVELCSLMKGTPARMELLDNTNLDLKSVWTSESDAGPPAEMFAHWTSDPKLWRPGPNPAADMCALALGADGVTRVALIERSSDPCKGQWALPGGFIKGSNLQGEFTWGRERALEAACRRFREETLCEDELKNIVLLGKFDALERDERNSKSRWVETWLFAATLEPETRLAGGDDSRRARWVDVDEVFSGKLKLAFDHASLLKMACEDRVSERRASPNNAMRP